MLELSSLNIADMVFYISLQKSGKGGGEKYVIVSEPSPFGLSIQFRLVAIGTSAAWYVQVSCFSFIYF
jgi:hypothetical protein